MKVLTHESLDLKSLKYYLFKLQADKLKTATWITRCHIEILMGATKQNNKQTTSTKLTHQTKRSKAASASGSAGNRMVAPPSLVRPNSSLIMQTLDDPHGGRGPRTTSYERRSKIKDKQRTRNTVNLERTMERQNDRTTGFCDVPETLGCSSDTFSPTQPHNTCNAVHAHPLVF